MPVLTRSTTVLASAAVAALIYLGAVGHDWAFDDGLIIESNPAAQSIPGALSSFFSSYWPDEQTTSGQYRPLAILWYAVDWAISDGSPHWFHFVNLMLHAVATALFVMVVSTWLNGIGALVAGLVFAVHPVHVEAVANVVGRAEILVAAAVFGCVLAARRYRHATDDRARATWTAVILLVLTAALFVKEHAVIIIGVLALDEMLDEKSKWQTSLPLYLGVAAVTIGWLYLWRTLAGEYVDVSAAATIRGLSAFERVATMSAAQLHVVRLLVWPMELAADYNPQMIPRLEGWSWMATVGLCTAVAIAALGVAVRRSVPVVTFGVVLGVLSYAPTSNLLFPSGVILSERNLYLAVAAPAVTIAWLSMLMWKRFVSRDSPGVVRIGLSAAVAGLLVIYSARTISRVPFWKDGETVLLLDYAEHPENYRTHLRLGSFLRSHGDLPGALAESITAGALYEDDPWTSLYSVVRALDLGVPDIALREALRAHTYEPEHPSFARLVVRAQLARQEFAAAAVVARRSVEDAPVSPAAMWSYLEVLDSLDAPEWQRHLARARADFVETRLIGASSRIDSALTAPDGPPDRSTACWEVATADRMFRSLNPPAIPALYKKLGLSEDDCHVGDSAVDQ